MHGENFEPKLDAQISPLQWKQFFDGACWQDILNTVNTRLIITRDELETASGEASIEARGAAKELRFILQLQEIIEQELETERAKREKETDNG